MGNYTIIKEQLKELKKPLLHLLIIILIIWILKPNNPLEYTFILTIYATINNMKAKPIDTFKTFITTYILIWIVFKSAVYGVLGFVFIILFLAGWRIYKNWKGYMDALHTIETMLYGKPLKFKKGGDKE